jgi:hypothetical protein
MSLFGAAWGGTPAVLPFAVSLSAPEGKQGVEPRRDGHVVGHICGRKSAVTACGTHVAKVYPGKRSHTGVQPLAPVMPDS